MDAGQGGRGGREGDLDAGTLTAVDRRRASSGSPYEPTIGFSRAIRIGERVLVSGTGPVGADEADVATQMRRCVEIVGTDRLACLHVNDSQTALGSNRDRHAPLGTGELGRKGCAAFFSEPRFEGLPAIFEGPGFDGRGAGPRDIEVARELRAEGLKARGRSRGGRGGRTRGRARAGARRRTRG